MLFPLKPCVLTGCEPVVAGASACVSCPAGSYSPASGWIFSSREDEGGGDKEKVVQADREGIRLISAAADGHGCFVLRLRA